MLAFLVVTANGLIVALQQLKFACVSSQALLFMGSASLLPLLRSHSVGLPPARSRRDTMYILLVALLILISPLLVLRSHHLASASTGAAALGSSSGGHPATATAATTSRKLSEGNAAAGSDVAVKPIGIDTDAAQLRGRRLAAPAPAPSPATALQLKSEPPVEEASGDQQLAPQPAEAEDAGETWSRSKEKMIDFVVAHIVFEAAAAEALPPAESALAEAGSAADAAADGSAVAAADSLQAESTTTTVRPLAPAEQQHLAAAQMFQSVAADAVTSAADADSHEMSTDGAEGKDAAAALLDEYEPKAAMAAIAVSEAADDAAAAIIDFEASIAALPAAAAAIAPAAETDVPATTGALAVCLTANIIDKPAAPFTVKNFVDGTPARCVASVWQWTSFI